MALSSDEFEKLRSQNKALEVLIGALVGLMKEGGVLTPLAMEGYFEAARRVINTPGMDAVVSRSEYLETINSVYVVAASAGSYRDE